MKQHPIDFVVTWLDSSDPEWQKEYSKYRGGTHREDNARFRNWDLFKYWFRSIETYAPWVNKVFLVTNGTFPKWINPNHPKLVLVKHSDFIPAKYLPTFNSHTIELHLHRIKGLSEHFVYHNDDTYLNAPINPDYYFINGLPCDSNKERISNFPTYNKIDKFSHKINLYCDLGVVNYHFNRQKVVRQSPKRWFGIHLGVKGILASIILYKNPGFVAFYSRHFERPMLKSIFDEIWEQEPEMMDSSCTRFRQDVSLSPYVIRYWQFATNRFHPISFDSGRHLNITKENLSIIIQSLNDPSIKSLCVNDSPLCNEEDVESIKESLLDSVNKKFPSKSNFEI